MARTKIRSTAGILHMLVVVSGLCVTYLLAMLQFGNPFSGIGGGLPSTPNFGAHAPVSPGTSTGGGSGSSSGTATSSPTPSPVDDTRRKALDAALNAPAGRQLKDQGYSPVEVLETASSNGQYSKWLDGRTARVGTYVIFRNYDSLVDAPKREINPDRVVMVNTSTPRDGETVGFFQEFTDGRSTLCSTINGVKLSDPGVWYGINMAMRGKSLGAFYTLGHGDTDAIPGNETVTCGAYRPDDEKMPKPTQ